MRTIFFTAALFYFSFGVNAQNTDETLQVDEFLEVASNRLYAETNGFYFLKVPKEKSFKDRVSGTIIVNDTNDLKIMNLDEFSKVRVERSSCEIGKSGMCTGDEVGHDDASIRMWRHWPDIEDPLRFSVCRRSLLPRFDFR